jgi:hypothetical protein
VGLRAAGSGELGNANVNRQPGSGGIGLSTFQARWLLDPGLVGGGGGGVVVLASMTRVTNNVQIFARGVARAETARCAKAAAGPAAAGSFNSSPRS